MKKEVTTVAKNENMLSFLFDMGREKLRSSWVFLDKKAIGLLAQFDEKAIRSFDNAGRLCFSTDNDGVTLSVLDENNFMLNQLWKDDQPVIRCPTGDPDEIFFFTIRD